MVMIAAIAIGFSLSLSQVKSLLRMMFPGEREYVYGVSGVLRNLPSALQIASFLTPLTWALTALRWRKPRPAIRRCLMDPGNFVCQFASAVLIMTWTAFLIITFAKGELIDSLLLRHELLLSNTYVSLETTMIACVIIIEWISVALFRRWPARIDWIDRMGLAIGACWIFQFIMFLSGKDERDTIMRIFADATFSMF